MPGTPVARIVFMTMLANVFAAPTEQGRGNYLAKLKSCIGSYIPEILVDEEAVFGGRSH